MKSMHLNISAASAAVRSLAKKALVVGMLILAAGLLATPMLMPSAGNAQDARVAKSMAAHSLVEKAAQGITCSDSKP
jgi:hypothetical protein